jgi:flagellar L-ring protein FlgH
MSKQSLIILMATSMAIVGCSSVQEAINGPQLAPMGLPSSVVLQDQYVLNPQSSLRIAEPHMSEPRTAASANTLWRIGARDFFNDQRAKRVGDILTVQISIDDSATTANATDRARENKSQATAPTFFGLESSLGKILPGGYNPASPTASSGSLSFAGSGSTKRSEKVNLTIAAMVTGVLPNGNLVIQGRQEVKTNNELRELTVAGLVRPEDISSANTIKHTQLAEARISYGGRGDISRTQKTPPAQAIIEQFSPF